MRGVLVHQHQAAIGGDGDDIGVQHLGHGGAQRVGGGSRAPKSGGGRAARAAGAPWGEAELGIGEAGRHGAGRSARVHGCEGRPGVPICGRGAALPPGQRPVQSCRSPATRTAAAIAEAQLALGGVDVHVHLVGRDGEIERHHGVAPGGDDVAIGDADGGAQHRVGDRAAIDGEVLRRGGSAGRGRGAGQARETERRGYPPPASKALAASGPQQGGDAGGAVLGGEVEQSGAVADAAEGDVGRGEGQAADGGFGMLASTRGI